MASMLARLSWGRFRILRRVYERPPAGVPPAGIGRREPRVGGTFRRQLAIGLCSSLPPCRLLSTSDRSGARLLGGVVPTQSRLRFEITMDGRSIEREVGDGIDRPRRDVRRHAIEKLVRVFATQNELAMLVPGESLLNLGINHRQQTVPETGDVEQRARLGVQAELRPGQRLEELLERAISTRKRQKSIREARHQRFATVH